MTWQSNAQIRLGWTSPNDTKFLHYNANDDTDNLISNLDRTEIFQVQLEDEVIAVQGETQDVEVGVDPDSYAEGRDKSKASTRFSIAERLMVQGDEQPPPPVHDSSLYKSSSAEQVVA